MNVTAVVPYLPALLYLTTVWVMQMRRITIPTYLHVAALVTGMAVTGITVNWIAPVISATFALVFFVAGVAIAGRYLTRTGLITVSVALAATPPIYGWAGVIAGALVAAIIGFIKIARSMGNDRALFTVYESATSLGMSGTALPTRGVDTDRIPAPEIQPSDTPANEPIGVPIRTAGRMRLTPYLLFGLLASALVSAVLTLPFSG